MSRFQSIPNTASGAELPIWRALKSTDVISAFGTVLWPVDGHIRRATFIEVPNENVETIRCFLEKSRVTIGEETDPVTRSHLVVIHNSAKPVAFDLDGGLEVFNG